jgi:UDP-N-acetylmuramyl tripeptide synthase
LADIVEGTAAAQSHQYDREELKDGFEIPGYVMVPDRKNAIGLGLGAARPGDTVVIAGKGHETYQILGETTVDFDDRIEARAALDALAAQGN